MHSHKIILYFIQVEDLPHIKIGLSTNVDMRLHNLQNSCPLRLYVRDVVVQYSRSISSLEHELHRLFADNRGYGEWFNISLNDLHTAADKLDIKRIEIPNDLSVQDVLYFEEMATNESGQD